MFLGIASFLKSAAMSAMPGGPRSPTPKEKPLPLIKLALDEIEKGIKGLGRGGGKQGGSEGADDGGQARGAPHQPANIRFYAVSRGTRADGALESARSWGQGQATPSSPILSTRILQPAHGLALFFFRLPPPSLVTSCLAHSTSRTLPCLRKSSSDAYITQPGYDDDASLDHVAFLLFSRKAELLVSRGDFRGALESIIEAKQVLDVIKRGSLANDFTKLEFAACLHCVIGQYCTRLGINDGALAHFSKAEARSQSEGTRLYALLLRSILVVDSPEAAAERATDAAVLISKAEGMLRVQGEGAGEGARSALAYLEGKLAAGACAEGEEALAKVSCISPCRFCSASESRYFQRNASPPPPAPARRGLKTWRRRRHFFWLCGLTMKGL